MECRQNRTGMGNESILLHKRGDHYQMLHRVQHPEIINIHKVLPTTITQKDDMYRQKKYDHNSPQSEITTGRLVFPD